MFNCIQHSEDDNNQQFSESQLSTLREAAPILGVPPNSLPQTLQLTMLDSDTLASDTGLLALNTAATYLQNFSTMIPGSGTQDPDKYPVNTGQMILRL